MKRKKTLLILGGVLVVLCAAIGIEKTVKQHVDDVQNADEEILALEADSLTAIHMEADGESLDFVKEEDTWQSADDADFPVDQQAIADFLDNYTSVHASFIIDDVEDYSDYGLDSPEGSLTFTEGEDTTTLELGGYSSMDSKRYVRLNNGNVYLVDDDPMETFTTDRDDYMKQDQLADYSEVTAIEINGTEELSVVYEEDSSAYTYSDSVHYFEKKDGTYKDLSTTNVNSLLNALQGLDMSDYATYTASAEDVTAYGLDSPLLEITVTGNFTETAAADTESADTETETEDTEQAEAEKAEEEEDPGFYTIRFGEAADDEDTIYFRKDDSAIIYKLSRDSYDSLAEKATYNGLRPTLAFMPDWDQVTGMDAVINGTTYHFELDHSGSENVWTWEGEEVDLSLVTEDLEGLTITDFSAQDKELTHELSITLYLDNESWPQISAELYQYDGSSCLIRRDGENLGLVSRSQMVDLKEAINTVILGDAESETETEEQ